VGLRDFTLDVPLWKRLLAGFLYGGVTEELLMRWFLPSVTAWGAGKIWSTSEGHPATLAWWTANLLVALLFGLGHLPATEAIAPLSAPVLARTLVLNGAASLTFGYLFWRRGLEASMTAHASTHIGLQALARVAG
jgi:membrane protease YdiL (CAAX protease family)